MKILGSKEINKNYGNKIYFLNEAKREFGKFFKFPDALIIEPEEMETMFPKYFFFLNGGNKKINKKTAHYIIKEILRKEKFSKKVPINKKTIIRSSSTIEDTFENTLAGVFKSIKIKKENEIKKAVHDILLSFANIFGTNIIKTEKINISLMFQKYINSERGGVLFYNSKENWKIEEGKDPCLVTQTNKKLKKYSNNSKELPNYIKKILDIAYKIKNMFNFNLDIEWVLSKKGETTILQIRPQIKKKDKKMFVCGVVSDKINYNQTIYIGDINKIKTEKLHNISLIAKKVNEFSHISLLSNEIGIPIKQIKGIEKYKNKKIKIDLNKMEISETKEIIEIEAIELSQDRMLKCLLKKFLI